MALLQNKLCHFYGHQKICQQAKFELSRWTLALSAPIFLFRSLNKVCKKVARETLDENLIIKYMHICIIGFFS